ncbi:hypothetical protein, partial [Xylanibacter rarus]|uniref:hypothetical protein n=1 Tax=Xylanibacter rarus TaxID=1676614 RepID=UPI003FD7C3EF
FRISVQADYGKKSECFSDHKLAALTFGSYILCCRIFRFAQQLVHIRQNNSLVVPANLLALTALTPLISRYTLSCFYSF